MDGKIFPMSEWEMGVTAPIFHPRCRGTTAPYFEDMEGTGERFARDVESGEGYRLPKETTYKEWKAMQDAAHGEGTVDKKRIMDYNRSADEEQYLEFKLVLGDSRIPDNITDFQLMKYHRSERWHKIRREYKTINKIKNKESYTADYREKMISTYYDFREAHIEMSDHALNRFLGQKARKTPFTKADICDVMNKPTNYKQTSDGRMVRFYPPLSVITDADTGEIVSIVVDRKKPKADWSELSNGSAE